MQTNAHTRTTGDHIPSTPLLLPPLRRGSVCPKKVSNNNAKVACRQLGLLNSSSSFAPRMTLVPLPGVQWNYGLTVLDELSCNGSEPGISECNLRWSTPDWDCAAGVEHASVYLECWVDPNFVNVRLVDQDGSSANVSRGRLEVQLNGGPWGTVSELGLPCSECAKVVCRQLGLLTPSFTPEWYTGGWGFQPATRPAVMGELQCTGAESRLHECDFRTDDTQRWPHTDDVFIRCGGL